MLVKGVSTLYMKYMCGRCMLNKKEALIAALNGEKIWCYGVQNWFNYNDEEFYWDNVGIVSLYDLEEKNYSIYKEKPKPEPELVKMYCPHIYFINNTKTPFRSKFEKMYPDKDLKHWFGDPDRIQVWKWIEEEMPATYEDCKEMQDGNN